MTPPFFMVIGLPSGGTSAVASILNDCGVDMGDCTGTNQPIPHRPYARWECAKAHREIIDPHWSDIDVFTSTPEAVLASVDAYVRDRQASGKVCGVKCLRASMIARVKWSDLMDFLDARKVRFIYAKRNPREVIRSITEKEKHSQRIDSQFSQYMALIERLHWNCSILSWTTPPGLIYEVPTDPLIDRAFNCELVRSAMMGFVQKTVAQWEARSAC